MNFNNDTSDLNIRSCLSISDGNLNEFRHVELVMIKIIIISGSSQIIFLLVIIDDLLGKQSKVVTVSIVQDLVIGAYSINQPLFLVFHNQQNSI